jgi:Domain of unknown function (DUF932)
MNTFDTSSISRQPSYSTAVQRALSTEALRGQAPAVFADSAHERTSASYTFVPTRAVLDALEGAGFFPVEARQAVRARSSAHARHVVRLRRHREEVQLRDSIPELVLQNAHDGRCAYSLSAGLFRVVCTNGLVVSMGTFPVWRVTHRGEILRDIVAAAVRISGRFEQLAAAVERMERTLLDESQRLELAAEALALRFPNDPVGAMQPSQLLVPRRAQDVGNDLWRTFNVLQENVMRGGLVRRSASHRLTRTRGIRAVREDVRLNSALWEMAIARAA